MRKLAASPALPSEKSVGARPGRRDRSWVRVIAIGLAGLLLAIFVWPEDGDAQRRRRRRRRDRDDAAEQQPQPDSPIPESPYGGPGTAGTTGAAQPAQPAGGSQPATPPFGQPRPTTPSTAATPATTPSTPTPARTATTPATPATATTPPPEEEPAGPDLSPLRDELQTILDELVQARARAAAIGQALFRTRLRILVQRRGDDVFLSRLVVKLDNGVVFRSEPSFRGDEGVRVFEGFATPGPHQVEFEIEQRARAGDAYRYTLRDSYRFEVLSDRITEITLVVDDDSEIAEDFADDESGEYDVRTRVRVDTFELGGR